MASKIAETTQSLSTAAEMRDTTKMLVQPSANWEEYLTPAPLSIAILGELVFLSSNEDFSINKKPPPNGFQYIKYPDSFRACLMQICNSGWQAFNEAHTSMDKIRIHTGSIPDYMKTTVDILFNASDNVINALLPDQLENIRSIADDCARLAENVEKRYTNVILIIQELLEACVSAQFFYGEELREVKKKIEENKMKEQTSRLLNEQSKKAMKTLEKRVEETQEAYKQSMASLPSGWEVVGMNFVDAFQSSMIGLMNGLISVATGKANKEAAAENHTQDCCDGNENQNNDKLTQIDACCRSGEIRGLVENFDLFIQKGDIVWDKLYDQKNQKSNAIWLSEQFQRIHEQLDTLPKGKQSEAALSLCKRGIDICEDLAVYKTGDQWDKSFIKILVKNIKALKADAIKFDMKSAKTLGAPAITPKAPMKYKADKGSSEEQRKLAGELAVENARFQIEQSREELKQTREMYEKSVENMEKKEKELNQVLIEMRNCEIKEISFDKTIKILVKGLDAMGQVKEQWEKMVRFFHMISSIIQISLSKTMICFANSSDKAMTLTYSERLHTKDILYTQAFQASNVSSLVHMISSTYTEVSNKFLMDRISSLGRLMAMDKERPEFLLERQKLQNCCEAAQDGILQLVLKNKKEFERKTKSRMAKIEADLKAVLPVASPEEIKAIKDTVQEGYGKETSDYY